jgi:hypothetical protein
MTKWLAAGSMAVIMGFAGGAFAQTSTSPSTSPGASSSSSGSMQMSSAQCESLWNQVAGSSGSSGSLTQSQAQPYVTNFSAVDTNNDGKIEHNEWSAACSKGLIHSSASTGAGTGTTGTTGSTSGTTGGSSSSGSMGGSSSGGAVKK